MRKFRYLLVMALLLYPFVPGCRQPDDNDAGIGEGASGKVEPVVEALAPDGQITLAGYGFPLTVAQVIKDLGAPDTTVIDKSEYCPVGQLHSWCSGERNLKVLVLGDRYDEAVDYSAESRLLGVEKCDPGRPSGFQGFLGIYLDDSDGDVRKKLDSFVERNPGFRLFKSEDRSPIHAFFGEPGGFQHQYVLEKEEMYFFFLIDKEDRLEAIIQASFNVLATC